MVALANVPTNEVSGFLINDGKRSNATFGDPSYLSKKGMEISDIWLCKFMCT